MFALFRCRRKVGRLLSWLNNLILTSKLLQWVFMLMVGSTLLLCIDYSCRSATEEGFPVGSVGPSASRPIYVDDLGNILSYVSMSPYNFTFVANNEELCFRRALVNVLIFAYTAPADLGSRQLIRRTWGSPRVLAKLHAVVVFPLGYTTQEAISRRIRMESQKYGDIVQADFVDSYRNLSYKGILMLKWARNYCKQAKFVLKVDIDVFVNIHAVVPFLLSKYGNESRFLGCKVHWRSSVMRPGAWCGKWCVPDSEYRAKFYPPYCWGSVYVVSGDLLASLENAIPQVPVWWIADVYLTGIVPHIMGNVKHIVLREYLEEDTDYLMTRLASNPASVLFGFIRSMRDVRRAWRISHSVPKTLLLQTLS